MAIIKSTEGEDFRDIVSLPDLFVSWRQRNSKSFIKKTLDYFYNVALNQYKMNSDTFVKNYRLIKGVLTPEDFYEDSSETKSFVDNVLGGLPSYIKHYSIMTNIINELVGEMTSRPDEFRVKAFDDNSKSEELEYRTEVMYNHAISLMIESLRLKINPDEIPDNVSPDEYMRQISEQAAAVMSEQLDSYTSVAERWGNKVLEAIKVELNLKEIKEELARDIIISNHAYAHFYEDKSDLGFNIKAENPRNIWKISSSDSKYTSDVNGRRNSTSAVGTISVMTISEIMENFPEITNEEIEYLKDNNHLKSIFVPSTESNFNNPSSSGIASIKYDTRDPFIVQERMIAEAELSYLGTSDTFFDSLFSSTSVSALGISERYVVMVAYFVGKKKIGKVTYVDPLGFEQTMVVDENFIQDSVPNIVSIEWEWKNQIYKGVKIGEVYHITEFNFLPYFPIIGISFETKNTPSRSLVDLMKPFQVIFNICMNQIYEKLSSEIGNIGIINIRRVPRTKDGDERDTLEVWTEEAKERGIAFEDDSPEQGRFPSNTSVARQIDLTKDKEIASRINLAEWAKSQCREIVGITRERLGSVASTQTATGVNASISQSFNQTEPIFVSLEYLMGQIYQAIIDASLYIEVKKPYSSVSYISDRGEASMIYVSSEDLKFRSLKVFPTNRPEDKQFFRDLRSLAGIVLQNGRLLDVIELYSTSSVRKMRHIYREFEKKKAEMEEAAAKREFEAQAAKMELEKMKILEERYLEEKRMAHEAYQKELDRIAMLEGKRITALGYGNVEGEDLNKDSVYDLMQEENLEIKKKKATDDYFLKLKKIEQDYSIALEELALKREELKYKRDNMVNDIAVAKINASDENKNIKTSKEGGKKRKK